MRTPIKVRLSRFRQRVVLTVRYFFRLPIDDLRDQQRENLDRQMSQTMETCAQMASELEARLAWYEARVPSIRKEYKAFRANQKERSQAEDERKVAFKELVDAGIPEHIAKARIWPKQALADMKPQLAKPQLAIAP